MNINYVALADLLSFIQWTIQLYGSYLVKSFGNEDITATIKKNLMLKQSELRAFCMLQSLACRGPKVPEIYILASLFATVGPLITCIDYTSSYRYSMILGIIPL